ncbi:MAG: hypothetical protein SNJ60_04045, partial [Pseudanabaenaceae cyanobacterium]
GFTGLPKLDIFAGLPNRTPVASLGRVSALLPKAPLSAAYPSLPMNRTWNLPTSPTNGGTAGGPNDGSFVPRQNQPGWTNWVADTRYPWVGDSNSDGDDRDPRERMPDVPPQPGPVQTPGFLESSESAMAPVMSVNRPANQNKALWFRVMNDNGNWLGEFDRLLYRNDRNPLIYTNNWARIGGGASGQMRANQNAAPVRLILPDTPCINPTTGVVDAFCRTATYTAANWTLPSDGVGAGTAATGDDLINLNLPWNPMYPSDQTSATGQSSRVPASAFLSCGRNNGNSANRGSRNYRSNRNSLANDGTCDETVRQVISRFRQGLTQTIFDPSDASPANDFAALRPNLTSPAAKNYVFEARNTYADNRMHVYVLNGVGSTTASPVTANNNADTNGVGITGAALADGLDATELNGATLTFRENRDAEGNRVGPSPVFVLWAKGDLDLESTRVQLDGVDPNNIFWVVDGNLRLGGTVVNPAVLVGNFIGRWDAANAPRFLQVDTPTGGVPANSRAVNAAVTLRSTRLLGFRFSNTAPPAPNADRWIRDQNFMAVAMTTVDQPILLPVLQIHSPSETTALSDTMPQPSLSPSLLSGATGMHGIPGTNNNGEWTERSTRQEGGNIDRPQINVYFVAGSSPSRSRIPYRSSITATTDATTSLGVAANTLVPDGVAEPGGGLANFVRFLGNWANVPIRMFGGFLQASRSKYASAPLATTGPYNGNGLDAQTLFLNPATPLGPAGDRLSGYNKAYQTSTGLRLPFFAPGLRSYGFDVGLLTQQPDLFAQRFTEALPSPNEFFRETNRDDRWTKALLCSLAPANPTANNTVADGINVGKPRSVGTRPTYYTVPALAGNDRPKDCQTVGVPATIIYN